MWLLLGANGQLGRCLRAALVARGIDHVACSRGDTDITDPVAVDGLVERVVPSVIVNAAAWTNVDAAEGREVEAEVVNRDGARIVAEAAADASATLVHVSTDYVFSGTGPGPIAESEPANPVNAYGRTKWEGEQAVRAAHPRGALVVRTAWLYSAHGRNFARTMAARALAGDAVRVIDDQHGAPTSADDLSGHIIDLVTAGVGAGTYHGTNTGAATWFGFAREIYRLLGVDPGLVSSIHASEYPARAARPSWSILGHDNTARAGVASMRPWSEALAEALPRIVAAVGED